MNKKVSISHLTFIVKDIEKSATLFKVLFDAKEVYDSIDKNFSHSREKFLLIDDLWIALMEGEELPSQTYNHIAFKIEKDEMANYLRQIESLGLSLLSDRSRIAEEAQSIYFYDYDNHLFELHTGTLEERLKGYLK
ncbi:FosX/FosE/FosI family fosfomycin resistance hydrolase [Vagococcus carniphilus]|uniref:FosX/FosE/FosI family fosfomycin resistance thiol transferase n=1 Tax=Vagococcus carniphilus TaxID=218144 RepID=A0A430AXE9_9ENTE|nr:FosX/FosE/FosI family fosfomycin resistance hydrolase [Vagococcus carniphilus]QNN73939.1 FosX/FosE/FosI family fosfomycin resistance thiol transferase [Vagococcus carniphilus]RSU12740.1 FosX/FosE/FosI family fosfomycin resistance thiol transferase [Vagococcus carniphilus]